MKRLLERDDDDEADRPGKKAKILTPEEELIAKILKKWQSKDPVIKYVLINVPLEELKQLDAQNYMLDHVHWQKSACDLLARHINDCRERKSQGGGPLDVVSTFKFRFKLDAAQDKSLRLLSHKDLRYVLNNYE